MANNPEPKPAVCFKDVMIGPSEILVTIARNPNSPTNVQIVQY